jgi:NAD/NADP transhydrogenase alpha subunit
MLHPLFSTLIQRPDLVVEHTAAYAALFTEEATAAGTEILVKVIAWALAVLAGVIFLGLAGTAVMLGALHSQFHWALALVPGIALLLVVVAVVIAMRPFKSERFPELRAQLDSDARALRMAS